MRNLSLLALSALLSLFIVNPLVAAQTTRWYSATQVEQGATLFQTNCAGCHGESAQGIVTDWGKRLADGSFPAPPLNGSAHAWHHPLSSLKWTIQEGSINRGGKMPGFKNWMSDTDQLAVISFFQNFWDDRLYTRWLDRGGLTK